MVKGLKRIVDIETPNTRTRADMASDLKQGISLRSFNEKYPRFQVKNEMQFDALRRKLLSSLWEH